MQLLSGDPTSNSNARGEPSRQIWMDYARGIGVTLVVLGHVLDGLVRARIFPEGPVAAWMIYTLYTFHMPLFFFLAGLNVQHSLQRGAGPFLQSKAWTIAYPYVLWSLIQGGIIMLLAGSANTPIYPGDLAAIWYRPIGQFWFLYALMICQVLAVLVPGRTAMIATSVAGLCIFFLLPVRPDLSLTLHHLPFFVAGLYGTRIVMDWQPRGSEGWLTFACVVVAFVVAVTAGGHISHMDFNGLATLPACMLGIAGMVVLCKTLGVKHRWLACVGTMSMTIYVMHILVASGMRIALVKLHVPSNAAVYLVAGTEMGVIVPMIAHAVLQRFKLLSAFGLAPRAVHRDTRTPVAATLASADETRPMLPEAEAPAPRRVRWSAPTGTPLR